MIDYMMLAGLKKPLTAVRSAKMAAPKQTHADRRQAILLAIDSAGEPATSVEISEAIGVHLRRVANSLHIMAKRGEVHSWLETRSGRRQRLWERT